MLQHVSHNFIQDDGQASVEYALVMLFAAIVLVLALNLGIGGVLDDIPQKFADHMP